MKAYSDPRFVREAGGTLRGGGTNTGGNPFADIKVGGRSTGGD